MHRLCKVTRESREEIDQEVSNINNGIVYFSHIHQKSLASDSDIAVYYGGRPALYRQCNVTRESYEEVVLSVIGIVTDVDLSPPLSNLSYVRKFKIRMERLLTANGIEFRVT